MASPELDGHHRVLSNNPVRPPDRSVAGQHAVCPSALRLGSRGSRRRSVDLRCHLPAGLASMGKPSARRPSLHQLRLQSPCRRLEIASCRRCQTIGAASSTRPVVVPGRLRRRPAVARAAAPALASSRQLIEHSSRRRSSDLLPTAQQSLFQLAGRSLAFPLDYHPFFQHCRRPLTRNPSISNCTGHRVCQRRRLSPHLQLARTGRTVIQNPAHPRANLPHRRSHSHDPKAKTYSRARGAHPLEPGRPLD